MSFGARTGIYRAIAGLFVVLFLLWACVCSVKCLTDVIKETRADYSLPTLDGEKR